MKKVLIVLAVIIVGFLGFVATRPDTFKVERSANIAASPEIVYAQIADFHAWTAWSPWEKLDPTLKRTYEGAPSGTGAIYTWVGNDKVGEGKMTIKDAKPNEKVVIDLEFIKPFAAQNVTTFTVAADGASSKVIWAMEGHANFPTKLMTVFKSMDSMVGGDFENGLSNLKTVAETEAKKRAEAAKAAEAAAPAPAPTDAPTAP